MEGAIRVIHQSPSLTDGLSRRRIPACWHLDHATLATANGPYPFGTDLGIITRWGDYTTLVRDPTNSWVWFTAEVALHPANPTTWIMQVNGTCDPNTRRCGQPNALAPLAMPAAADNSGAMSLVSTVSETLTPDFVAMATPLETP